MELGITLLSSLFAGWLAGRVFKRPDYSLGGDLVLGAFGAFVGLNLPAMLWGLDLTSGLSETTLSAAIAAFAIVSMTRLPILTPDRAKIRR
jgi:uncharacterized membrane protein YeaQ/YmgE (transglycosylase-associated protein family)